MAQLSHDLIERLPHIITADSVAELVALLDENVRWGGDETSESTCGSRAQVEGFLRASVVPLAPVRLVVLAVRPSALLVCWYSERQDLDLDEPARGLLVLSVGPARTIADIRVPDSLADAYARVSQSRQSFVDVLAVPDCPHVDLVVAAVRSAAAAEGVGDLAVDVRIVGSAEAAELAHFPGSPLVRVNGMTAGSAAAITDFGARCLLPGQLPSESEIRAALRA